MDIAIYDIQAGGASGKSFSYRQRLADQFIIITKLSLKVRIPTSYIL